MQKLFFTIFICLLVYENNAQIKYTDSLKEVLIHTTKPIDRFTIINKIIEVNNGTQGSFQDTFYSAQLYRIAQQLSNDSLLAISLNVIGNYFRFRGDNPGALDYFFKAIPLAEKAKDKRRISSLYFDIAACYTSLQNREESFKYNKLGEANLPDKSSPMYNYMAAQFYSYMAMNYLQANQLDSALMYLHQLDPINHSINEPNPNLLELLLYASTYAQLKDTALAELYFKKAKILCDSAGTILMFANFSYAYVPYLLGINQFVKAKNYALILLNGASEIRNNVIKLTAAGYLNTAYNNLHKPDSAYYYLSIQSALKDSVFNQNNLNKIQVLAFNEQIRQIDEEAKAKQAEEERKQNIQYALIALGIIIFITIFLLLSRTIIVNERLISFFAVLGLLVVFEFINLLIHPWLASFTHDSPVLMLLSLVLIAALLIPLHHRLEHWIKEKMIEKNKAIRLAAAKKTIAKLEG